MILELFELLCHFFPPAGRSPSTMTTISFPIGGQEECFLKETRSDEPLGGSTIKMAAVSNGP